MLQNYFGQLPWVKDSLIVQTRPNSGKGRVVVASKSFQLGDLIIAERPVLAVSDHITQSLFSTLFSDDLGVRN